MDTFFGYPGGAVLNLYDEIYKNSDKIKHILTSHEQGAAHAADGYARATGKVGVCIATSGPGATNLVTGIATAFMDSVPMVCFTGQVPSTLLGKDSFQEVDIAGITMPVTKHNFIVKDVKDLAKTIRDAFFIAKSGRPGPVLIDICKDATAAEYEYEQEKPKQMQKIKSYYTEDDLMEVAELINNAKKPFIHVGGGAIITDANKELYEFAKKINAPVSTTLMGIGAFPEDDDLFIGMIGMHGTKTSNLMSSHCDLFIAIGARFSDRVISDESKFAQKAKLIHIDGDAAEINKNVSVGNHLIGDVKDTLSKLNKLVKVNDRKEWVEEINQSKAKFPLKYNLDDDIVKPQYVLEVLSKLTDSDCIITTEVGQNQMWAALFFQYKYPRTYLTSGGLGTMGYGLGASLGAQIGRPDKQVFNISGDGSFMMNLNELATINKYNIPVKILLLNNGVLGMVRQWQDLFYEKRFSETYIDKGTDYVKLAEAFGIKAYRVDKNSMVEDILKEVIETKGPVFVEFVIDKDEMVYPIVQPGAPISKVITL